MCPVINAWRGHRRPLWCAGDLACVVVGSLAWSGCVGVDEEVVDVASWCLWSMTVGWTQPGWAETGWWVIVWAGPAVAVLAVGFAVHDSLYPGVEAGFAPRHRW